MSGIEDVFGKRSHRPDHPDFWRISEVLLANDGDMEAARTTDEKETAWAKRTGSVVDVPSVTYASIQRTILASAHPAHHPGQRTILAFGTPGGGAAFGLGGARTGGLTVHQQAAMAALWVDAFVAGAMYQQRGGHQPDPT